MEKPQKRNFFFDWMKGEENTFKGFSDWNYI